MNRRIPKERWTFFSNNEEMVVRELEIDLEQREISGCYKSLNNYKNRFILRSLGKDNKKTGK